jgi:hypothetical protein
MTTATHTTETLKPILDKIAKLKTLADKPGTPEEAAAAVAAIQRLMTRYSLTAMQVEGASRNDERGFDKTRYNLGGNNGWRSALMNRIAKYTFCTAVFDHAGAGCYIVGEEHNVVAVTGMYEYLVGEIMRLADLGWDTFPMQSYTSVRRWKNAFKVGAADAVADRLKEQYDAHLAERQAEDSQTSALVVVKNDALAKAVRQFFPQSRNINMKAGYSDIAGRAAGERAGRGINLADQIAG